MLWSRLACIPMHPRQHETDGNDPERSGERIKQKGNVPAAPGSRRTPVQLPDPHRPPARRSSQLFHKLLQVRTHAKRTFRSSPGNASEPGRCKLFVSPLPTPFRTPYALLRLFRHGRSERNSVPNLYGKADDAIHVSTVYGSAKKSGCWWLVAVAVLVAAMVTLAD